MIFRILTLTDPAQFPLRPSLAEKLIRIEKRPPEHFSSIALRFQKYFPKILILLDPSCWLQRLRSIARGLYGYAVGPSLSRATYVETDIASVILPEWGAPVC